MTELVKAIKEILNKSVKMVTVSTFLELLDAQEIPAVTVFDVGGEYMLRAETQNKDQVIILSTARDQHSARLFKTIDAIHSLMSGRFKLYTMTVTRLTSIDSDRFAEYFSELSKLSTERVGILERIRGLQSK